jgi:hypothetical protein
VEKYCRAGQATDEYMAHALFMMKTKGYKCTNSGFAIFIVFPQQQCLHERASMLRYTFIAYLVSFCFGFIVLKSCLFFKTRNTL